MSEVETENEKGAHKEDCGEIEVAETFKKGAF